MPVRLGRLVGDRIADAVDRQLVGVVEVPTRHRTDSVRPQEAFLVEHPRQDPSQLVFVDQRQQTAPLDAGAERIGDVGYQVPVALQ
jgi:hypothetical protein